MVLVLLLLLLLHPSLSSSSSMSPTSAYDVLRSHGLPMGLLPKGIQDFRIDAAGRFEVELPSPCSAKFESQVRYDRNVSGTLSYGEIAFLSGISAQDLFLWFPVRRISVDVPSSGLIYFDVGVVHKQFSLSLFETPPECVPVSSPDPAVDEGANIARLVAVSNSGKLRYSLEHEYERRQQAIL